VKVRNIFAGHDIVQYRGVKASLPVKEYDLLVRITGYSAIFVDMSKGAQDAFISREELQ